CPDGTAATLGPPGRRPLCAGTNRQGGGPGAWRRCPRKMARREERPTFHEGRPRMRQGAGCMPAGTVVRSRCRFRREGHSVNVAIDRSIIRAIALFAGMTGAELAAVLSLAVSRRYPAGAAVFEQGQAAEQFFVLLHGRSRVTQVTPEGQQVVVRMVNPGDLFGIAR